MKTAGFRGELTSNGQIAVPREIASQVPPGEPIRVLLQWDFPWTRPPGGQQVDANLRRRTQRLYIRTADPGYFDPVKSS